MREIKFRFYSNHLGKFITPDDSIFVGALKDLDMNPMQYTGLKDKNGTDIYEGDIVTSHGRYPRAVDFFEGCFGYISALGVNNKRPFLLKDCRNLEVIGNVHESPELLK